MFGHKGTEVESVEQLISALEHVEEDELQSDLKPNVRAELMRMRNNISAVLSLLSHCAWRERVDDVQLQSSVNEVRRLCVEINGTISKILVLQFVRARQEKWITYTTEALVAYREMVRSLHRACALAAPQFAEQVVKAM